VPVLTQVKVFRLQGRGNFLVFLFRVFDYLVFVSRSFEVLFVNENQSQLILQFPPMVGLYFIFLFVLDSA